MSETDDNQALSDDEFDGIVAGTGEWWEGLDLETYSDISTYCN
jgi:hypothetical protein